MKIYLKGFVMGTADAIPGVSGGTIALITGIYQRLITALSSPDLKKFTKGLNHLWNKDLTGIKDLFREMDIPFIAVLGAGVVSALILVLNLMKTLLEAYPVEVYGFFFGLILFSAVILYREVELVQKISKIASLTGFLFALLVSGIGANSLGHSPVVLFFSGAVAISAMILPGISGSLILVILGQYEYMSQVVSNATDAVLRLASGGSTQNVMESGVPAIIFISGAVTGILTVVNIVEKALERNREATMAFLVSLMLGALRAPVIQINKSLQAQNISWIQVMPELTLSIVFGGLTIYLLDKKTVE